MIDQDRLESLRKELDSVTWMDGNPGMTFKKSGQPVHLLWFLSRFYQIMDLLQSYNQRLDLPEVDLRLMVKSRLNDLTNASMHQEEQIKDLYWRYDKLKPSLVGQPTTESPTTDSPSDAPVLEPMTQTEFPSSLSLQFDILNGPVARDLRSAIRIAQTAATNALRSLDRMLAQGAEPQPSTSVKQASPSSGAPAPAPLAFNPYPVESANHAIWAQGFRAAIGGNATEDLDSI